jgi:hypothetical protein
VGIVPNGQCIQIHKLIFLSRGGTVLSLLQVIATMDWIVDITAEVEIVMRVVGTGRWDFDTPRKSG